MPVFSYHGRDQQGHPVSGHLDAETATDIAATLMAKGITPTNISARQASKKIKAKRFTISFIPPVKLDDMVIFCRQAQALLKSGIPLFEALMKVMQTTQSPRLKLTLAEITKSLAQGQTLSAALRRYPNVFSPIFCSLINAGESSGKLDAAFLQLAGYMALEVETKKRIKAATRYPVFVILFVLSAMLVINFFVMPSFSSMYESFNSELPLPTQIIMATSKWMTSYWYLLLILAVIIVMTIKRVLKSKRGGYFWDKMLLRLPVMGGLVQRIILARFARILTMMIRSGVPIVDGLHLVAQSSGNRYIHYYLSRACNDVKRGTSITKAMTDSQLFTPLVLQMLEIGEQSSNIDEMMEEVANFYEGEVEYDLSRLSDLIEPILLLFVAGLVMLLMVAVFLPMWDMISFVKG